MNLSRKLNKIRHIIKNEKIQLGCLTGDDFIPELIVFIDYIRNHLEERQKKKIRFN